jgi:hypothetical protein
MNAISESPTKFYGDPADLEQFQRLVASPIRSETREQALHAWEVYKLAKQAHYIRGQVSAESTGAGFSKRGRWTKGDYIKSLTAPAIDLRGGTFPDVVLGYADLRGARFDNASFNAKTFGWMAMKGARLERASLRGARFSNARLMGADVSYADLTGAHLPGADLSGANLAGATLAGADLAAASLERANLVGADLHGTNLRGTRVYGAAVWDVQVESGTSLQHDLIVTPLGQPEVTVDNIEVAQFVYLLLNNPKIRGAIDTICKKGVLILGRFVSERKVVLNALRDELRRRDFVPIVFDFEKPTERDITETVKTLAGLSRFIIADITNPKSSPLELQATVPDYQVPFVPIIARGEKPFSMFADLRNKYASWVLDPLIYDDPKELIGSIEPAIIKPALAKHAELLTQKAADLRFRDVRDYRGE